jgi:hypothetical protein
MTSRAAHEDSRSRTVDAAPDELWQVVAGLGGARGWPGASLAWRLRGRLDRLAGGPGHPRVRRDPDRLRAGDPVDSWLVEQVEPGRRLVLRSRMRLPGTARLELSVQPAPDGRSRLQQRVSFVPHGPAGTAYWWAVAPLHGLVLARQLAATARAAERRTAT